MMVSPYLFGYLMEACRRFSDSRSLLFYFLAGPSILNANRHTYPPPSSHCSKRYNPSIPFEYSFVNEEFGRKFSAENQAGKLAGIFAVLAVFISCMGLLGLSMFMAERRTKEIGIRKVLGASVTNLWLMLSKEFIGLVLLACVIASPLAFWIMKSWLQNYEYRIHIGWWVFAGAGSLVILLALLTVSTQTIKAAGINPVKNLRAE